MSISLLSMLFVCGGDCNVQRVVSHQEYVAPVVHQQSYAVQFPVFVYSVSDTQRVDALTKIAEQNAAILQQQTQLIQALNASPAVAAKASPSEAAARAILQRSCVSCHSGAKPKGGIDLSGALTVGMKSLVADAVEDGRMPPKPEAVLSDADFQTLDKWKKEDRAAWRAFLLANVKKSTP